MNGPTPLERLLATDPRDVGCAETFENIDAFAELTLDRRDAAGRYPGVAAHLSACTSCAQDFQGLLAAASCIPPH